MPDMYLADIIWLQHHDLIQGLNELDKLHLDLTLQSIQMINQNAREPCAVTVVSLLLLKLSFYVSIQNFFQEILLRQYNMQIHH